MVPLKFHQYTPLTCAVQRKQGQFAGETTKYTLSVCVCVCVCV